MSDQTTTILIVVGSLREASHNRRLAQLAASFVPDDVRTVVYTQLAAVEPFNEDHEGNDGVPPGAADWLASVRSADAVLVVTPEYNGSIPGQLKNAFDWASRNDQSESDHGLQGSAMYGRPVAVATASTGQFGAVWAGDELRKVLRTQGARVVAEPVVAVGAVHTAFTDSGALEHDPTQQRLHELLDQLLDQVRILREAGVQLR